MQQMPKTGPVNEGPPPEPTAPAVQVPLEVGGPPRPEPTRYGDWERNGRCVDF